MPAISGFKRTTTFLPTVSAAVRIASLLPITVGLPKFALALVITSNFTLTSANAVIDSNWEYDDTTSVGFLGSGWSLPSSCAFSFPTTGIYEVRGHSLYQAPGGTNTPYAGIHIIGTADNFSSEHSRAVAYSSQEYDDFNITRYHNVHVSALFDVTDTSNVKFKLKTFRDVNYGNIIFAGSSNDNYTWLEIIRLGDT